MNGSVNKVILIGRVGKDPEIRSLQDGSKIANFSLATSERWRDKSSGENKEVTEWTNIAVFNDRIVDVVGQYVKKGSHLYVEGSLKTRKWTDKQGQERYTTEVMIGRFIGQLTMLDGRSGPGEGSASSAPQTRTATPPKGKQRMDDFDEEVPF